MLLGKLGGVLHYKKEFDMDLVWENYTYLIYYDGDVYYLCEKDCMKRDGWERSVRFCSDSFDECSFYIIEQECS